MAASSGWPGDRARAGHAAPRRRLGRLARVARRRPGAVRGRGHEPDAGTPVRRGGRALLRGLLQRHAVAAVPRRHRAAGVPPASGGTPTSRVNQRFAEAAAEVAAEGARRLGAGLPAAARPADAARAASRPADRLLPAHPVPADGAVHAAAVAAADPRGPARRRSRRVPAPRRRANFARLAAASLGSRRSGDRDHARRPDAGPRAAHSRSRSTSPSSTSWPHSRRSRRGPREIRDGPRQPEARPPRRRPARLHEGHPAAAARLSASCSTRAGSARGRRSSCRSPRRAASGSSSTAAARRHRATVGRINGDARRDRTPGHQLPARVVRAAKRWWRCSWPPTSWW